MMEISQKISSTGIIMPHNWDEGGRIIEIALYTNTEEVYAVEHNRLTQELMNLMHNRVEVKGKIMERQDGSKSIAVQSYMVLEKIIDEEMKTN
jgi:hypothetical protein